MGFNQILGKWTKFGLYRKEKGLDIYLNSQHENILSPIDINFVHLNEWVQLWVQPKLTSIYK